MPDLAWLSLQSRVRVVRVAEECSLSEFGNRRLFRIFSTCKFVWKLRGNVRVFVDEGV